MADTLPRRCRQDSGSTSIRVSRAVRDELERYRAQLAVVRSGSRLYVRRIDFTMDDLLAEVVEALRGGKITPRRR